MYAKMEEKCKPFDNDEDIIEEDEDVKEEDEPKKVK